MKKITSIAIIALKLVVTLFLSIAIVVYVMLIFTELSQPLPKDQIPVTVILIVFISGFLTMIYLIWRKPKNRKQQTSNYVSPWDKKPPTKAMPKNQVKQNPTIREAFSPIAKSLQKSSESRFKIHPDLQGLIWFADGSFKNYTPIKDDIPVSFPTKIPFNSEITKEHSAIYTNLPIRAPENPDEVSRPPYYPRYDSISPEQRWMYLQLLENPYKTHDVGYAFILYYGLENLFVNESTAFVTQRGFLCNIPKPMPQRKHTRKLPKGGLAMKLTAVLLSLLLLTCSGCGKLPTNSRKTSSSQSTPPNLLPRKKSRGTISSIAL